MSDGHLLVLGVQAHGDDFRRRFHYRIFLLGLTVGTRSYVNLSSLTTLVNLLVIRRCTRRCIYGDLRVLRCRRVGCEVSETVPDLVESGHGPKNLPFEKMFAHVLCSGLHTIQAVPYSNE